MTNHAGQRTPIIGTIAATLIDRLYKPVSGFLSKRKLKKRCAYHASHPEGGTCSGIIADQFRTQGFSRRVMKRQFAACHEAYTTLQSNAETAQQRKKRKREEAMRDGIEDSCDLISFYWLTELFDGFDCSDCSNDIDCSDCFGDIT